MVSWGQRRMLREADRVDAAARQQHAAVGELHIDMVIGGGRGDLALRRQPALGELPLGPAAGDHQPASLGSRPGGRADAVERRVERPTPIQCTSLVKVRPARIAWIWESIRPGNDGAPAEIDDPGVAGPASARTSPDAPSATILPARTASASAGAAPKGTTLPLRRSVSGACARVGSAHASTASRLTQRADGASTRCAYRRCSVQLVSISADLLRGGVRRTTPANL